MTPSHLVILLKENLLRISSGLKVMLRYFCFNKFGVLGLSKDDCWFHQVQCAWFLLRLSELSFLVNWIGSNFPCLLLLILDLARSCRACFCFYSIFSFVFVSCAPCRFFSSFISRGRLSVSFLVLYCHFCLLRTPIRLFSCFVLSNMIRWHFISDICFFYI